jgi:hypothetical protein
VTRCALLVALAGILLCASNAAAQGDLRRVQSAIHPGPKFFLPELPHRDSFNKWFDSDGSHSAQAGAGSGSLLVGLGILGVAVATAPIWGPHELWDAGFDERGWFPPHPHALDDRPYIVVGNCPSVPINPDDYLDPHNVKPWALRLSIDAGNDFDDLTRVSGQLFLDTSIHRLGFLADWTYYAEHVPGGTDDALMTNCNLTWRVTQSERLLMHIGAGLRTWTADGHTDPGLNALYRADLFPVNGVHLAGLFEVGDLRSALVLHGEIQAGYTFSHGELYIGYDALRVKRVLLQTPVVGLRFWF